MKPAPLISIVIPVFNDEATISGALESALRQTLAEIEIICVDDASTDDTVAVIEGFRARDERVRLIQNERNTSAFQSRRSGILAAKADYVLFLDGDDELVADAAMKAHMQAHMARSDLVGFGVTVVEKDGRVGGAYERRLQPRHRVLEGDDLLSGLFPIGEPAQGQLWRYVFRTELVHSAYALLPENLELARVNDLPLMFLVAALAKTYSSIPDKLYRYHFGRGGSGHGVDTVERAEFYASAIRSIDSIRAAVERLAGTHVGGRRVRETYESVRLSIIGYVCSQLVGGSDSVVLDAALAHLHTQASARDIERAAARFYPDTLSTLKFHATKQDAAGRPVRSVLLATSNLQTGGVSAVLASQARLMRDEGYRVTIVARSGGSDRTMIPDGAEFVELTGRNLVDRLKEWGEICRRNEVDVVIDHQVLYISSWPEYALMARAEGAATIGWMHNFVGRPIYDGNDRLSLIERCSNTLVRLVVLSPLDVAYFKLRGIEQTSFVPNPPSPLLIESTLHPVIKTPPRGRIELVWWGRLEQHTKQVRELIEVGVHLRRLEVDFRLTVIGPDWHDMTVKRFNAAARRRRVSDQVVAIGPLHGQALVEAIDAAHAFVSTSIIEGYQLTIAEAQARGLPVFMYELPWLTLVQDNDGVVAVPQGDAAALAREIVQVIGEPDRYARLSRASVDAAHRALSYDFGAMYRDVVAGSITPMASPQPTLEDARELLRLMVFFAGRSGGRRIDVSNGSPLAVRLWQSAAPLGRAMLRRFPGLRPLAHRAKGWFGAH